MPNPDAHPNAITLVISEVVEPGLIAEYEAWTKGINRSAQAFTGFLGVEVIRPREHDYPEYVVIVKFDNYTHYRQWIGSSVYQTWMAKSHQFVTVRTHQELPSGLELWFTLPSNRVQRSAPAYYKQVILGVMAVYPLILLANFLLAPMLIGLPALLSLFVSVCFVSALLTYPVMPWLSKLLSFWLYPTPTRKN